MPEARAFWWPQIERMGRWFLRFLADQGYQVGGLDVLASDDENAWGREALPTADLVLCAAPPVATARLYDEWATSGAPPRGVIVDIASIKSPLVPAIRRLQAAGARVGSLHPMFGPSVALLRDADVVVCGHTHVQYDRRAGRFRVVNAGSVGMPYEGSPDARWALLGDDGLELVTTPYDAEAALDTLAQAGFPLFRQWFVGALRGEVSAEEATASFESRRA